MKRVSILSGEDHFVALVYFKDIDKLLKNGYFLERICKNKHFFHMRQIQD